MISWRHGALRPSWLWSDLWLDLRALGVFRLALGAASLVEVIELITFQGAFLDENGVCPLSRMSRGTMFDLYLACKSPESVFLLLLMQLLAVLCFMLGFWTRVSGFVCWVFAMSQHHRLSNCVEYGGDRLRSHLFFWSLFQPLGLVWSIDAYLQSVKASHVDVPATEWIPWCFCPRAIQELPHPKKEKPVRNTAAPLSAFLILLQLASMYEYTASTKVGESWESGDAVLQTLHLTQYARQPVASILALFPSLCRLFTHATLYIEKYGWFLAFLPFQLSRFLAFSMFFGLHFGLNLSLRVGSFQLFVLSAWCVALPRYLLDCLEAQLQRFPRLAQLLVMSQAPIRPSAAKIAMRLGCVTACNLLGFSLIFLAIAEGCLHRDRNQCAMAPVMHDFGAQQLLTKLDLLQRYNMFSPDPPRKAVRVQLYGVLASPQCTVGVPEFWKSCRVVELWSDRGFPSCATKMSLQTWENLSAPAKQPVDFATNRWRKLVENSEKSKGLGGYMCSQWQASHSHFQQLLGLWLVRVSSEWPNVKESFAGEMKYWCSSHAKELMQKLPPQPWLD